mgnify:CR=1 FL=1
MATARNLNIDFEALLAGAGAQFRDLNTSEPGQWPLLPKLAAWLCAAVVMVVIGWFGIISPAVDELAAEESREEQLKEQYKGRLDVDFALRYEPTDRTLRAYQIKVNALEMDGLAPAMSDMLATYSTALVEQAMGQVVLYQLQDKDLALVDALAMEPGTITVTAQGLTIALVQKASSSAR